MEPVSSIDVLDRVERFRTLSADSAGLLLAGLRTMDHPMARLETGLLLIHGPAPYRDLGQGISELRLSLQSDFSELTPDARRVIDLIVEHAREMFALVSDLESQAEALAGLRQSNVVLQEKLDALRKIDGTLESEHRPGEQTDNTGDADPSARR